MSTERKSKKSTKLKPDHDNNVQEDSKASGIKFGLLELTKNDLLYPREVNEQLLQQIQVLKSDKKELMSYITSKEDTIQELNENISCLKENIRNMVATGGTSVSTESARLISSKITDLCNKNRHLTSELGSIKYKYGVLEKKLLTNENIPNLEIEEKHNEAVVDFDEVKDLRVKLASVTRKFIDIRNKNIDLKNELLLAKKCLQNEVGESFVSLKKLATDPVGYRGRAEEIAFLQTKVANLERRLHDKDKSFMGEKKMDHNLIRLKDIEERKRNQLEKMVMDYKIIQAEHKDVRQKLEGATARIKTLTGEAMTLRQKNQILLGKSANDDDLLAEMNKQLKHMEQKFRSQLQQGVLVNTKHREEFDKLLKDLENERFRAQASQEQLTQKTEKIEKLEAHVNHVIDSSLQRVYLTSLNAASENEITSLTQVLTETNKRLCEERKMFANIEKKYFHLKEIKTCLEKKYKQLYAENTEFKKTLIVSRQLRSKKSLSSLGSTVLSSKFDLDSLNVDNLSNEFSVDDGLKNKLDVANEQIVCLEKRLEVLEEEHASDLNCLEEMIMTSKKTFVGALKKLQTHF